MLRHGVLTVRDGRAAAPQDPHPIPPGRLLLQGHLSTARGDAMTRASAA